jgi:hypothetical protein
VNFFNDKFQSIFSRQLDQIQGLDNEHLKNAIMAESKKCQDNVWNQWQVVCSDGFPVDGSPVDGQGTAQEFPPSISPGLDSKLARHGLLSPADGSDGSETYPLRMGKLEDELLEFNPALDNFSEWGEIHIFNSASGQATADTQTPVLDHERHSF